MDYVFDYIYKDACGVSRDRAISNLSIVTGGWTASARRLLFRDVRIRSWVHFNELVRMEGGRLLVVRTLHVDFGQCGSGGWQVDSDGDALFRLLQRTPNLVQLDLVGSRFPQFRPAHSRIMRSTVLLPHLIKLTIVNEEIPRPVIFDLLATSQQRIKELACIDMLQGQPPRSRPSDPLNFGGNLRKLSTQGTFNESLLDPSRVVLSSLVGLESLSLEEEDFEEEPCRRMKKLFDVVGGSLRKLRIEGGADNIAQDLPSLTRLTELDLDYLASSPAPVLRKLPPSITTLSLKSDDDIGPVLRFWILRPDLAPRKLQHISIRHISDKQTWSFLPRINKFTIYYDPDVCSRLREFTPSSVPFRILELRFLRSCEVDEVWAAKFECAKLGIELLPRTPDYS